MSNSTWLEQEREAQQERDDDYWARYNRHMPIINETSPQNQRPSPSRPQEKQVAQDAGQATKTEEELS